MDGCVLHWMISCFHNLASHGQDLYSYASITQLTMAVKTPIIKKRTKPFKWVQMRCSLQPDQNGLRGNSQASSVRPLQERQGGMEKTEGY